MCTVEKVNYFFYIIYAVNIQIVHYSGFACILFW